MDDLRQAHPGIRLVEPSSEEYAPARMNAMGRGSNRTPLGFAYPKNAQEVSDLIRWVRSSQTDFCIRGGGNDFYGRSLLDGGLVIDISAIKSVKVSDDKKTVTFGGGIPSVELVEALEKEGLTIPFGNTGFVGYVGWVTMGGYGPLTKSLGMGFEGIVGAELVTADGAIIKATEEILEGLRGMGGNLGVVTSMTVKTHSARKFLSGQIIMDGTEANIRGVVAASKSFEGSSSAVLHHFVMSAFPDKSKTNLTTNFSWDGEDMDKGKEFLNDFVKAVSPVKENKVKEVTGAEFMNGPKYPSLPFGGGRSVIAKEIDAEIIDAFVEGLKSKPAWGNLTWADNYDIDNGKVPKNTFGPGKHALVTFADVSPDEASFAESKEWADGVDASLRKCKVWTSMAYPPLTPPGTRTAKEMMGDKYERAMELKRKYDPDNLFKHAVPNLSAS